MPSYTHTSPSSVSRNLIRLREEAGWGRRQLAEASNVNVNTIEKFESSYEPPTNHPYFAPIQKALSAKLGRDVSSELYRGGKTTAFSNQQLFRVYMRQPRLAPPGFFKNGKSTKTKAPAPTNGAKDTPQASIPQSTPALFEMVQAFNIARMQSSNEIKLPLNAVEPMLSDLLKQSGISSNVLIGEDFAKLAR